MVFGRYANSMAAAEYVSLVDECRESLVIQCLFVRGEIVRRQTGGQILVWWGRKGKTCHRGLQLMNKLVFTRAFKRSSDLTSIPDWVGFRGPQKLTYSWESLIGATKLRKAQVMDRDDIPCLGTVDSSLIFIDRYGKIWFYGCLTNWLNLL